MQKLLATLITIILYSTSGLSQRTILIHEKSNGKVNYSQIFKSAKIVKLETKPECLISIIAVIKVDGDRIFAFDLRLGIVFIFSQDGHFIGKIGRKGKGPGEMITPRCFALDKINKQIEIIDISTKKMFIFDFNGNFIKANTSVYVMGFEKFNNSNYIGYSYNASFYRSGEILKSESAIFDSEGRIVKEFKDIRTIPRSVVWMTGTNLFMDNNKAYIIPIFENNLFQVDQSLNINTICNFKFDTKIPKNFLKEGSTAQSARNDYARSKYPYLIYGLKVIKDNLNLTFIYNHQIYSTFWNLNSNESITANNKNFINDFSLVGPSEFRGSFNEGIIQVVEATEFIDIYTKAIAEDIELSTIQTDSMKINLATVFKATTPNDNPILMFYTYK